MTSAVEIREKLIASFRAELTDHVQTMNDGLLELEQSAGAGERQFTLDEVFRAAHSLKGAARAMGVTMVEQLAHAIESVLDDMQHNAIEMTSELFTACYRAVDAIENVQAVYEAGETTPPLEALQALSNLEQVRYSVRPGQQPDSPIQTVEVIEVGRIKKDNGKVAAQAVPATPPIPANPAPVEATLPSSPDSNDNGTIRVSVDKLDALMAQLGELLITKIRAEQRLAQVRQLQGFVAQWQKEWVSARSTYNRLTRQDANGDFGAHHLGSVDMSPIGGLKSNGTNRDPVIDSRYGNVGAQVGANHNGQKDVSRLLRYTDTNQNRLRQINTLINDLSHEYANDTMHMSMVIDELEQEIKRVRMLPLNTITATFGRMVRDLAQEANKEAVLQIVGGETELDKRVLEQIKDPLMHLLRNAVDHGIKPPNQREASGKPRAGTVTIKAEQLGKDVVVSVSDDGEGFNLEAIRQVVARKSGVDARSLSEEDLKEAIFNVGISTSPIITDVSGRGVGMDVVRRNVEILHGRIDVDSAPGQGVTFTLTLPLTLTSSRGLLVRVSGDMFAIPHNAIERIMFVTPKDVALLGGHDTILYDDHPLALVRLGDVLDLPRADGPQDGARIPVVILAAAERRMAFAVDELAGEQEIVIKGLGKQLARVGGVTGATVMGSGEVVLILNVADLIKLSLRSDRRSVLTRLDKAAPDSKRERRAHPHILVVDDSITTRMLEKNILEAAGYIVQLAIDGQEALDAIAANGTPDLIVSDVVMPRLNGFEFAQRVKEDQRTADVPLILVTSLDSAEDKARGIAVGADAYITKNSFDQNNLLETIAQLI